MVTGRDRQIACTRGLDSSDPLSGIELCGVEGSCNLGVLITIEIGIGHVPLTLGKDAIEPPVEEDPEATIAEFLARSEVLLRRLIILLRMGDKGGGYG